MDEKPKSIWKKSWRGPRSLLLGWLVLMIVFALIFLAIMLPTGKPFTKSGEELRLLAVLEIGATAVVAFICFIRWVCCWRNFKRVLFGLACLATAVALFYAEEDWRGKHAWEKFKREGMAKGEAYDWQANIPAPVPDEQNFALTPVVASSYEMYFDKNGNDVRPRNTNVVDRLSMVTWQDNHWAHIPHADDAAEPWQTAKPEDLKAWQEYFRSPPPANSKETNSFPVAAQVQSPVDDVLLALRRYDGTIEEIRAASSRPDSRFPLTYGFGQPANILLPHLSALRSCVAAVNLRALAELQKGQSEQALADVQLALRLVDAIRTEPFYISQVVRMTMLQNTLQPVWEGLAGHRWSYAQLAALEAALAKFDLLPDCARAMRGERALEIGMLEYLRTSRDICGFPGMENKRQGGFNPFVLIPSGWFYQNELRIGRFYGNWYLPLVSEQEKVMVPAKLRAAENAISAETHHWSPENFFERWIMPALGKGTKKITYAQACVDLARTAVALERYKLAHGEYPDALDGLAPQFIAQVPHDVIGGGPLKYRRTSDGQFVLYSIGWNEKDDGGVVANAEAGSEPKFEKIKSQAMFEEGDWVWRYPPK